MQDTPHPLILQQARKEKGRGKQRPYVSPIVKNPAAETAGRPLFECVLIAVIPASEVRRESLLWKGKQPIPDKPE